LGALATLKEVPEQVVQNWMGRKDGTEVKSPQGGKRQWRREWVGKWLGTAIREWPYRDTNKSGERVEKVTYEQLS